MHATTMSRPVEILLVEDEPGDVRIAHAIIRDADAEIWVKFNVVRDGREATAFLRQEGPYAKAPRADLVLLDGKTSKQDGRAVQAEVSAALGTREIPVVVLTGSRDEQDFRLARELNRRCSIPTSPDVKACRQLALAIKDVWRGIAALSGED